MAILLLTQTETPGLAEFHRSSKQASLTRTHIYTLQSIENYKTLFENFIPAYKVLKKTTHPLPYCLYLFPLPTPCTVFKNLCSPLNIALCAWCRTVYKSTGRLWQLYPWRKLSSLSPCRHKSPKAPQLGVETLPPACWDPPSSMLGSSLQRAGILPPAFWVDLVHVLCKLSQPEFMSVKSLSVQQMLLHPTHYLWLLLCFCPFSSMTPEWWGKRMWNTP